MAGSAGWQKNERADRAVMDEGKLNDYYIDFETPRLASCRGTDSVSAGNLVCAAVTWRRCIPLSCSENRLFNLVDDVTAIPGAGLMEAEDRQATTVFTVQPSFHHRHSTNRVS